MYDSTQHTLRLDTRMFVIYRPIRRLCFDKFTNSMCLNKLGASVVEVIERTRTIFWNLLLKTTVSQPSTKLSQIPNCWFWVAGWISGCLCVVCLCLCLSFLLVLLFRISSVLCLGFSRRGVRWRRRSARRVVVVGPGRECVRWSGSDVGWWGMCVQKN